MTEKELARYRKGVSLDFDIKETENDIKIIKDFIKNDVASKFDLSFETPQLQQAKLYIMRYLDSNIFRRLLNDMLETKEKRLKELKEEFKKL